MQDYDVFAARWYARRAEDTVRHQAGMTANELVEMLTRDANRYYAFLAQMRVARRQATRRLTRGGDA